MKQNNIDYYAATSYDWNLFTVEDYRQYKVILEASPYDPELAKFFHKQKKLRNRHLKQHKRYIANVDVYTLDDLLPHWETYDDGLTELATSMLTPTMRRRFLAHLDGYTIAEIAITENVSEETVKTCLKRARKTISEGFDFEEHQIKNIMIAAAEVI